LIVVNYKNFLCHVRVCSEFLLALIAPKRAYLQAAKICVSWHRDMAQTRSLSLCHRPAKRSGRYGLVAQQTYLVKLLLVHPENEYP
jgi:hypothetical protein